MNATKTRRLVRTAAVATVLAVPALSACSSTNFDAPTDQYYTPADGENDREGTVDVLHALIISETPGSGRLIAGLASPGATGDEPVGVTSDGSAVSEDQVEDDRLTGVRAVGDSEGVQFSIVEGETTIPVGGMLQLADDGSAVIAVSGDPELVAPGQYVRVAFAFESGEEVEVNVPVLEPGTDYADIEIPESTGTEG